MEQLTRKMLDTLANLGNSEHTTLISVENTSTGILVAGLNEGKFVYLNRHIEFKGSPLERIIISRQFQTFPATFIELSVFPVYEKTTSLDCLCMPLLNERLKVVGIAVLSQKMHTNLPHERLQILNVLASLLAITLEENSRLEQLATTDQLTKLYTRNYFEKRLQEEFTRVQRHGGVISLLLLEIDNFKQINDTCGYQQGLKVLQETSELLRNTVRKEIDIACRYGNKHFIVLLPSTNVDGAYILAERVRHRCEKRKFTTSQGIPIKVTVSIGISNSVDIPHGDESSENDMRISEVTKEELIHRADLMLRAAKQAGCNQVMVWW